MAEEIVLADEEPARPSVHCDYCSSRIPADSFEYVYWSGTSRLLSAACPGCDQRTTLSFKVWRRKSGMSVPSEP
jgi:hypothetical protein